MWLCPLDARSETEALMYSKIVRLEICMWYQKGSWSRTNCVSRGTNYEHRWLIYSLKTGGASSFECVVSSCTRRLILKRVLILVFDDRLNVHVEIICRALSSEEGINMLSLDVELWMIC